MVSNGRAVSSHYLYDSCPCLSIDILHPPQDRKQKRKYYFNPHPPPARHYKKITFPQNFPFCFLSWTRIRECWWASQAGLSRAKLSSPLGLWENLTAINRWAGEDWGQDTQLILRIVYLNMWVFLLLGFCIKKRLPTECVHDELLFIWPGACMLRSCYNCGARDKGHDHFKSILALKLCTCTMGFSFFAHTWGFISHLYGFFFVTYICLEGEFTNILGLHCVFSVDYCWFADFSANKCYGEAFL